jgi:segregation and condensation protein B
LAEIRQLPLPAPGLDGRPTAEEAARVPFEHIRLLEAILFASTVPLEERALAARMPEDADLPTTLKILAAHYAMRGVQLQKSGNAWAFRTAPDLAMHLAGSAEVPRKLSRAALEVLSVIAYHQPVTRSEIEEVRGVSLSKGTLELLLEIGWIRLRGRRRTPGRPVTFGTTTAFLDHFGLETLADLPDIDELKAAGLLDQRVPPGFDLPGLAEDKAEDPIEEGAIWQDEPLGEGDAAEADDEEPSFSPPERGGPDSRSEPRGGPPSGEPTPTRTASPSRSPPFRGREEEPAPASEGPDGAKADGAPAEGEDGGIDGGLP